MFFAVDFDKHMGKAVGENVFFNGIDGKFIFGIHPDAEFNLIFMHTAEAVAFLRDNSDFRNRNREPEQTRCFGKIDSDHLQRHGVSPASESAVQNPVDSAEFLRGEFRMFQAAGNLSDLGG